MIQKALQLMGYTQGAPWSRSLEHPSGDDSAVKYISLGLQGEMEQEIICVCHLA